MTKRQWLIFFVYLLLLALAIPWYWPHGNLTLIAGVPTWVLSVILVGFFVAILTAWNLLSDSGPEEDE
jgi:hypothetical protein